MMNWWIRRLVFQSCKKFVWLRGMGVCYLMDAAGTDQCWSVDQTALAQCIRQASNA